MTSSQMRTLDFLAIMNGLFYFILGCNWAFNIYLLLKLRRKGIV